MLSQTEVETKLAQLPKWQYENNCIRREITTSDFMSALALVNKIGEEAEQQNHHPEIRLSYGKVSIALTTHDAGGVTEKDFQLAEIIDGLVDI